MVLSRAGWGEGGRSKSYTRNDSIIALDNLVQIKFTVVKQGRGSEVRIVTSSQLSGSLSPESMDFLIGISQLPQRAEQALLKIKAGVEMR